MARTRNLLADLLGKWGGSLFRFLSNCEERSRFASSARWLKVGVLGVLVSLIATLTIYAREPQIMCYAVAKLPEATISDVSVSPSPTQGTDSVRVRATARVTEPSLENNYISSANLQFYTDTVPIPMLPLDGEFSDTMEIIEAQLYVGNLEPGTTWVWLNIQTSLYGSDYQDIQIVITEPDSTVEEE